MSISFGEFDSIIRIVDLMLSTFSLVTTYLTFSLNDLVQLTGVNIFIPSFIGDQTPLGLMLGVGLPLYLAWQFITWFLNVVT